MTAPAADDGPCYYNDNDPEISSWLANLVAAGMLPEGRVDGRDIAEVRPADIEGARQVHLFAGIGGWALALRLAGAEHLAGVWTASCPCQPFSVAGAKQGTDDERHLWPDARTLIEACRPRWVFGEQTPGPLGMEWLDGVIDDCEAMGYTVSAAVLPASAVGAPTCGTASTSRPRWAPKCRHPMRTFSGNPSMRVGRIPHG